MTPPPSRPLLAVRRPGGTFLAALASLGAAALFSALGCGYSLGYRLPPQVQTIAVPIFHNATFPLRRDVEFDLTEEVRRELLRRTTLRLVSSAEADLVLRGRIIDFRESAVVEGDRDRIVESSLLAVVDIDIEDYRNGYHSGVQVRHAEPFSVAAGESFLAARRSAIERLAERIVAAVEYWDDYEGIEEESEGDEAALDG